jgi:hypothetical protein
MGRIEKIATLPPDLPGPTVKLLTNLAYGFFCQKLVCIPYRKYMPARHGSEDRSGSPQFDTVLSRDYHLPDPN